MYSDTKKTILFVAFGSTVPAVQSTYEGVGRMARQRFRGWDVAWAFTSGMVRERLAEQGMTEEAERAWTHMVEMRPAESESHAALATVRDEQKNWSGAVEQWRHVARIRELEPTGHLALARALIKAGDVGEARVVSETVMSKDWPSRFGNVKAEARSILQQLDRK